MQRTTTPYRLRDLFVALFSLIALSDLVLAATADRPNVLFIAVDDLRPEFGAYGGRAITPHLDRLSASATRFDRAYCQQAVCGASRLSIMGGLYPTRTGEQTFHIRGWRERHAGVVTLNQHFRRHGFRTLGIGKVYHASGGVEADADNWDQWITLDGPTPQYVRAENVEALRLGEARLRATGQRRNTRGPMTESAEAPDTAYKDGRVAARVVEEIEGLAAGGEQPFFFAVGFSKPHLPFVAPKRYWDLYERADFRMPENTGFPPGYPLEATNRRAGEMRSYSDYFGAGPADFPDELNRRLLHGYMAAVSYTDACLGRVLGALDRTGLAENTVVVLWGDHGWKLGDHESWCKHTNFECDTRVPLLVRDPRVDQVRSSKSPVELIDLYPTLCGLAGLPNPPHCQGQSFQELLTTPGAAHRTDAYSSYPVGPVRTGHSLRSGDFRYTEWRSNATGEIDARVLTDLEADPGEVTNVIDRTEHAETLERLASRLDRRVHAARGDAASGAR